MVPDLAEAAPRCPRTARPSRSRSAGREVLAAVNREVTSADVKYAIERGFFSSVNTGFGRSYFGDLEGAKLGAKPGTKIPGITTPDDADDGHAVSSSPTGGVMAAGALAIPLTAPVPEDYAAKFDAEDPSTYGENQVATGPYMIENDAAGKAIGYQPGKRIHLVRNPNWDKSHGLQAGLPRRDRQPRGQRRHRASPRGGSSPARA